MRDCKHGEIVSFSDAETGEAVGLWACAWCGHKFVPLDLAMERDAGRYSFLKNDFSVMSANIDGQHAWAYRRNFSLRGPTLDAAIDAAMGRRP